MISRETKTDDPDIKRIELKHGTQKIDNFMRKKQIALQWFETIKENTDMIRQVAEEYGAEWNAQSGQKLRGQATKALEEGQKVIIDCKKGLNRMKRNTNQLKKNKNKTPELKNQIQMRRGIQNTLLRTFIDLVREFKSAEDTYHESLHSNIKRSVHMLNPQAKDDDIEDAINRNGGIEEMMQNVLDDRGGLAHENFEAEAEYVRSKNADLKQLERSIQELKQMFEDLAALIEQQSEQIDKIDVLVDAAVDNVEMGKVALKDAAVEVNRVRQKIMTLLFVIGGIVVVLGVAGGIGLVIWQL